jgi:hypothetical protein
MIEGEARSCCALDAFAGLLTNASFKSDVILDVCSLGASVVDGEGGGLTSF